MSLGFGICSTSDLRVSLPSLSFPSVSASNLSKYVGFRSCLCCRLFLLRSSYVSRKHWFTFFADTVLFWAKWLFRSARCSSNVLSISGCSLSSLLSWPDNLQSVVFKCLSGLLPVIIKLSFWSTKLNRSYVAVRVVVDVRVCGSKVAAAQESQRNRYITAWISSFPPAWFFTGLDWLKISQK